MRDRISIAVIILAATSLLAYSTQDKRKPYAGEERRELKALSADEINAYLSGQGMGLAKAAELNHYPGPRHVLELAAPLQLSEKQRAETQRAFDEMHREAVRLGHLIVEREKELDSLFSRGEIDAARLQNISREIGQLQGDLRATHLGAHLEMRKILTPAQIQKYDELRGYGGGKPKAGTHGGPQHHGKH